ncbi:hypothetical protein CC1G_11273 [Coprinopsis cinerea okayama7|uniref:BTB domain-containing protein n=1 Tax=Coprinopsis cinerea (strain Okayama-7 / 130 / ATCC MYA-4618 / FGSC 9003) TaxID=240176 RepID=A8PDM1_COPC7|nr:hypothetical protein CC1G_11273 [Coprinopsis cinerea okayama7\|eukprot:XP_001840625.1 hypothetical protein CC1G_11273 [Coprinopsis cinerea okayama7\
MIQLNPASQDTQEGFASSTIGIQADSENNDYVGASTTRTTSSSQHIDPYEMMEGVPPSPASSAFSTPLPELLEPPQSPTLQIEPEFFWQCVQFEVQGHLVKLPLNLFIEHSEKFAGEYGMLLPKEVALGGWEEPKLNDHLDLPTIKLEGIQWEEFKSFLKALVPRSPFIDTKPTLTESEWISVLKLSTRWYFNDLRKVAIAELSKNKVEMDPIQRVCLAKAYHVYDWLLEGYEALVEREEPITEEEGEQIGMGVALKLCGIALRRARGRICCGGGCRKSARPRLPPPPGGHHNQDITDAFSDEIERVRNSQEEYLTRKERVEKEEKEREGREAEEKAQLEREANERVRRAKEEAEEEEAKRAMALKEETERVAREAEEEARRKAREEEEIERLKREAEEEAKRKEREEEEKAERMKQEAEEEAKRKAREEEEGMEQLAREAEEAAKRKAREEEEEMERLARELEAEKVEEGPLKVLEDLIEMVQLAQELGEGAKRLVAREADETTESEGREEIEEIKRTRKEEEGEEQKEVEITPGTKKLSRKEKRKIRRQNQKRRHLEQEASEAAQPEPTSSPGSQTGASAAGCSSNPRPHAHAGPKPQAGATITPESSSVLVEGGSPEGGSISRPPPGRPGRLSLSERLAISLARFQQLPSDSDNSV